LKDRMGEMVMRSHRIQTVASDNILTDTTRNVRTFPTIGTSPSGTGTSGGGGLGFPLE
jgi:hypothetical protein